MPFQYRYHKPSRYLVKTVGKRLLENFLSGKKLQIALLSINEDQKETFVDVFFNNLYRNGCEGIARELTIKMLYGNYYCTSQQWVTLTPSPLFNHGIYYPGEVVICNTFEVSEVICRKLILDYYDGFITCDKTYLVNEDIDVIDPREPDHNADIDNLSYHCDVKLKPFSSLDTY